MVGWSQDTIPINIRWDELGYVKMLALAHDDEQCWYYYPDRVYVCFFFVALQCLASRIFDS